MPKVTIGASWDGGDYYPAEYVNRLYSSVKRNTTIPFDFVLYTGPLAEGRRGEINEEIRIVPTGLPSWWMGFKFWMQNPPGIETDRILYLDIDQVITGSLDDLINFPADFACMKDYPSDRCPPGREREGCVSTVVMTTGHASKVWDEYVAAGMPTWNALTGPTGALPYGVQSIINDPRNGVMPDLFPENWVCSYKGHVRGKGLPEGCRVVAFHGKPKQADVKENWIGENWR